MNLAWKEKYRNSYTMLVEIPPRWSVSSFMGHLKRKTD